MGARGFDSKHGVGILLNKRWKRKIINTECISERMTIPVLTHQQRKIVLTSVYMPHTGYTRCASAWNYIKTAAKSTTNVAGDFNAQFAPGEGSERNIVGQNTLDDSNTRRD